jgi:glycosyltransferase involved in cell wall biosynthesis
MMEAWICGTPCLVHSRCEVTREHVIEAGGGLYFDNYEEFRETIHYLMGHPEMRRRMGESGRMYVTRRYAWDTIIQRWIQEVLTT